jgi:uncharacterized protein YcbX
MATIAAIYRYPVKGLSPERLPSAALAPGQTIRNDRAYAIENGPSGFDPAAPRHFPKQRFLMLMRNERLARLKTKFDDDSATLVIGHDGQEVVRACLDSAEGQAAVEAFFARYCADELRGPPKLLQGHGHSFSDVAKKVVSIINLASVRALEEATGTKVDPLRFRGNLLVDGWPAGRELELVDASITAGSARLKGVKRIVRCAATEVDPKTGVRDLPVPRLLMQTLGHINCGVYAEVMEGGSIAEGDGISG